MPLEDDDDEKRDERRLSFFKMVTATAIVIILSRLMKNEEEHIKMSMCEYAQVIFTLLNFWKGGAPSIQGLAIIFSQELSPNGNKMEREQPTHRYILFREQNHFKKLSMLRWTGWLMKYLSELKQQT